MVRYIKKPIIVEAVQLSQDTWNEVCEFVDIGKLADGKPEVCYVYHRGVRIALNIPTSKGITTIVEGDWIIKGIKDELLCCKPDIFEATYELIG